MTKAEREEAARKLVCPRCHAEGGRLCRQRRGMMGVVTSIPMKTIHKERLEAADRLLAQMKEEGND